METREVPKKAFELTGGAVELGDNGDEAKSAPFKMTARKSGAISHWYWGNIVHDFDGMKFGTGDKGRIAIDYNHDPDQIIGFANRYDATGDLELSGALCPDQNNPSDRASEVVRLQKEGVPYEASIFFDADEIEDIPRGLTTHVNGSEFEGPGVVVRSWTLRGCAVCPHGADPDTETAFNKSETKTVKVIEMEKEELSAVLDEETTETQATPETDEVVDGDQQSANDSDESEAQASDVDSQETVELSEGERFLEAFGDQGGVWFAQGKSFAEAQEIYLKSLRDENDDLRKKVSALEAVSQGEESPATFSSCDEPQKKRLADTWKKD